MENYRRTKRQERAAVDGFIGPKRSPGSGKLGDFGRERSKSAATSPKVANLRDRPDGFVPTPITPSPGDSMSPTQRKTAGFNPIPEPDKKKRLFGRWRKAKKTKPGKRDWRKIAKRGAIIFVALMVLSGGSAGLYAYLKARKVLKGGGGAAALQKDVDPTLLKGEGDGRINILVLGKGGEGHEAPDLTDTIIIASIDPVQHTAALFSLPRDFWVNYKGSNMKINAVYATEKSNVLAKRSYNGQKQDAEKAGLAAIEQTIESTIGIPLHYNTMVDFEAFRKAIDTVGGVDINAPQAVYEVMRLDGRQFILDVKPGQQRFDGLRALAYARSRHTSPRGDFDRSERQRLLINGLKDKVLSLGVYSNPVKVSQLINAFGDHVQTNFSLNEINRLYAIAKDIPGGQITSLSLVDPPNVLVTTGMISGQSVVIPKAGVGNYKEIQSFVRNALRDSYLKQENASIAVLNGTETPGLATTRAEELRSFGYNVTQVADAPTKNFQQTTLVDMRSGAKKYTQHYLESRLKLKATTTLPNGITPGTADFVIILGQNETNSSQN